MLGGVGGTATPSDGSVDASKLVANLKDYLEDEYVANGSQTTYTLTIDAAPNALDAECGKAD